MKSALLFLLTGSLLSASDQIQDPDRVQEEYYAVGTDTSFTYSIRSDDEDSAIQTLISHFGQPASADAGHITWSKIEVSGIGENLTIQLMDGIRTTKKNGLTFVAFKNEKQKNTALKKLNELQSRTIMLEFKGDDSQNFSPTPLQRANIVALLTVILSVIS